MSNLKRNLIRLGSKNPDLRKHLRPILDRMSDSVDNNVVAYLDKAKKTAQFQKLARSLTAFSNILGKSKLAFLFDNASTVDRAIMDHFRNEGLRREEIPDIDWGDLIIGTGRNVQRHLNMSDHKYEEALSNAIQDIVIGENLDTDRDRYKDGNLAEKVKAFLNQGYDRRDIRNFIGNQVAQHMENSFRRHLNVVRREPGEENIINKSLEKQKRQEDSYKDKSPHGKAFEEFTKLDESNPAAKRWMNTDIMNAEEMLSDLETRRDLQNMLDRVDEKAKKDDPRMYVVWEGWKQNPGETKFSEIVRSEISYTDPETGQNRNETVAKALERFGSSFDNVENPTDDDIRAATHYNRKLRHLIEATQDEIARER